ncbi:uncharacterized protein EV154DRAFT_482815 [Mucor mucedo]|uniref:uncharacterized protein n=1 Tax=Mucor mucedo TaxID=29922 RepID=UPI00221FB744|nr:uncharacterized protein EV154DRAFT_482815 [Mucor mucedo]KAI7889801.1 hypothetical protein EV154DRAFT_482815 [Mucor mucedo]
MSPAEMNLDPHVLLSLLYYTGNMRVPLEYYNLTTLKVILYDIYWRKYDIPNLNFLEIKDIHSSNSIFFCYLNLNFYLHPKQLQAVEQSDKVNREHLHGHFLSTESMKENTLLDRALLIL